MTHSEAFGAPLQVTVTKVLMGGASTQYGGLCASRRYLSAFCRTEMSYLHTVVGADAVDSVGDSPVSR